MSLLGFNALGRLALGQVAQSSNGLKGSTAICTVLGPRGLSRPPYASFAGKPVAADQKSFSAVFSVLGPRGLPRPPWASFAGKPATVIVVPPPPVGQIGPYYGLGHYRLELERARQLAAITRKVPGLPIDRRTAPRFEPLRASPIAPAAPVVDLQAAQNERMAAAAAATEAANKRRRRDEEALLLLAC